MSRWIRRWRRKRRKIWKRMRGKSIKRKRSGRE